MPDNALVNRVTTYSLPEVIWELVQPHFEDEGIMFTEEYPEKQLDGVTIVWRVFSRTPGKEGVEELKPRLRLQYRNNQRDVIQQWEQYQTTIYQFDVFGLSSKSANQALETLEYALFNAVPELQNRGVEYFGFHQQLQDDSLLELRQPRMIIRSIRYLCVMSNLYVRTEPAITQADINLKLGEWVDTIEMTRGTETYDEVPTQYVTQVVKVYCGFGVDYFEYVAGKDYSWYPYGGGTSKILWYQSGARPSSGAPYSVQIVYPRHHDKNIIPDP